MVAPESLTPMQTGTNLEREETKEVLIPHPRLPLAQKDKQGSPGHGKAVLARGNEPAHGLYRRQVSWT